MSTCARAFQFGQKKFRLDSRYRIDFFDSIRQSDKFAACTLIFERPIFLTKRIDSHNESNRFESRIGMF